ncbi:MAG TPA: zf-HC2 domain-containing protein [Pyrinomonadaceae bacterium]|nr:zf-HC2 domain-containing protein [Pyrinomonadaceae bacterium]
MNCKACLKIIGEYFDGELSERMAGRVADHLESCPACAHTYEQIQYEQTVYARVGQQLEFNHPRWETVRSTIDAEKAISPATPARRWFPSIQIAAPVAAVVLISIVLVFAPLRQKSTSEIPSQRAEIALAPGAVATGSDTSLTPPAGQPSPVIKEKIKTRPRTVSAERKFVAAKRSETPSFDVEKFRDPQATTLAHIEQSQMLLRSFRNAPEDIAFETQRFQKLLSRNVLLRCEAIAKGNLPEEEVLTTLEPILIDIANLPDRASKEDVRSITETIRKTEIVAMLQVYSQTNNR